MKVATWGVFSGDVCLCTFNEKAEALQGCGVLGAGYTVKPLIVAPDNLMSHKAAWLAALRHVATSVHTEDDRDYWQHELNAMQAMYKELEK